MSQLFRPGDLRIFRPQFPGVNNAGIRNAEVSKYTSPLLRTLSLKRLWLGSETQLGLPETRVPMLSQFPGIVTLSGGPLMNVVIPETCQPPRKASVTPRRFRNFRPFPTGNS